MGDRYFWLALDAFWLMLNGGCFGFCLGWWVHARRVRRRALEASGGQHDR